MKETTRREQNHPSRRKRQANSRPGATYIHRYPVVYMSERASAELQLCEQNKRIAEALRADILIGAEGDSDSG